MEIRFLVRIRGALTPPPTIETPVVQMPLPVSAPTPTLLYADVPCGSYDGEADAQRDAQTRPCVWRNGFEELSDLEDVTIAVKRCPARARVR
jgi:hypothetical protein